MASLIFRASVDNQMSPEFKKIEEDIKRLSQSSHKLNQEINKFKAQKQGILSGAIDSDIDSIKELQRELKKLQDKRINIAINNPVVGTPSEKSSIRAENRATKDQLNLEITRVKDRLKAEYNYELTLMNEIYNKRKDEINSLHQAKVRELKSVANTEISENNKVAKSRKSNLLEYGKYLGSIKGSVVNLLKQNENIANSWGDINNSIKHANDGLVSLVRRTATFVSLAYGGYEAFKHTLGVGIDFNNEMEQIGIAMETIIASTSELKENVGGKWVDIDVARKWEVAREEVELLTGAIKELNAETPHTLDETAKIFNILLPQARASKATYGEVLELTNFCCWYCGSC